MTTLLRCAGAWAILTQLLVTASAYGQDKPPLSASPAAVTLDTDGTGSVQLSNDVGVDLELTLGIVGDDGAVVANASVDPRGRTLAAGSTAAVTVNVPGPPPTSTLVVVAAPASGLPQGAAVRVPLSKTAPATPAVTEWTLTHTHAGDDSGTELPLTSACEGLGLSKRVQVGTVQADGKELAISGSCSDAKAKSLMLTTPDISSDGRTYKGKIKVADAEVDLTVEDTLSWMAVALLIAIGIGAAIGVTAWQGWGRGARDLLRKTYLVEQLVSARNERSADASFAKAAAELGLPPNVQAWTIADAVRTKLAGLRSLLRGTPTADGLKKSGEETRLPRARGSPVARHGEPAG